MSLTKDGFYKQIGGVKGNNNYLLQAGGGAKAWGNASGNIPVSNGTVNTDLNADLLDGKHLSELFEDFTNAGTQLTRIKIGGVTKDLKIDADTLDGYHASSFALSGHNHDRRYLRNYHRNDDITSTEVVDTDDYIHNVGDTGGSSTTMTKPSGMDNAWGILHMHLHVGNYSMQLGFGGTTGHMYFRNAYNSSTFGSWKTLIDSDNIGSQSVNYATSAGNADTLDGYHANGLFTTFENAGSQTTRITIGGVTKDLKIDADTVDGYHKTDLIGNLSVGNWNPRGTNLAVDWYYNGGDMSISESGGQMSVSVDGYFYQNEGQYKVLDENNYSSYIDDRYVNVTGDTMTGALNIKGNGSARANLNLVSSGNVPNDLYFGSNNSSHWSISSRESGDPYIGLYNVSKGWAIKVNYDNNYVGIGTTSPSEKLEVSGNIRVLNPSDNQIIAKFLNYSSAPYGLIIKSYTNGSLHLQSQRESNNSEVFPLLLNPNGGNVGIGTTSPSQKLHVEGNELVSGTSLMAYSIKILPSVYSELKTSYGLSSDYESRYNTEEFLQSWVKYAYANGAGYTVQSYISPNSRGFIIADVYASGINSSTGYPEHITGRYYPHGGGEIIFGTSYGSWYYRTGYDDSYHPNTDYIYVEATSTSDWMYPNFTYYGNTYRREYVYTKLRFQPSTGHLLINGAFDNCPTKYDDGNDRPGISITGSYPQLSLISNVSNSSHGPVFSIGAYDSAGANSGGFKTFRLGTKGYDATWLDLSYGTHSNVHEGIDGWNPSGNGLQITRFHNDRTIYNYGTVYFGVSSYGATYYHSGYAVYSYDKISHFSYTYNKAIIGSSSMWNHTLGVNGDVGIATDSKANGGYLHIAENTFAIDFRPGHGSYGTGFTYGSYGNEYLALLTEQSVTSIIFGNGYNPEIALVGSFISNDSNYNYGSSSDVIQIKQNCMNIGGVWTNGVGPDYKLKVNGKTYINYSGGDTDPSLTVIASSNGSWRYVAAFLAPNLTDGYNVYVPVGQSMSTRNAIGLTHYHYGSGSTSNYAAMEIWGVGNIQRWYYGDMRTWFAGRVDASGFYHNSYGSYDYLLTSNGDARHMNTLSVSNSDMVDGLHAERFTYNYTNAQHEGESGHTLLEMAADTHSNSHVGMLYSPQDNPVSGSGRWIHVWSQTWNRGVTSSWVSQIALNAQDGTGMYYRTTSGNILGKGWERVLDTYNWTSIVDGRYLPLVGGTMTGTPYINMPASAASISNNQPFGITYGRIQGYGDIFINADTDGSTSEYVHITAGYGAGTSGVNYGLGVGYNNLYWKGGVLFANTSNVGIGTTSPSEKLSVNGWVGTIGQTGWYNISYGGGIWMNDSTYVRVYNSKRFWTDATGHFTSSSESTSPGDAAIEIRERGRGTTGITHNYANAPRIGFHWGNRYWANLTYFDNIFRFMDSSCSDYIGIIARTAEFTNRVDIGGELSLYNGGTIHAENSHVFLGETDISGSLCVNGETDLYNTLHMNNYGINGVAELDVNGTARFYNDLKAEKLQPYSDNAGKVGKSDKRFADIYAVNYHGNYFYGTGFIKNGSSDSYVLLGGGGHKALSDFSMAHSHPYLPLAGGTMTGAINLSNTNARIAFGSLTTSPITSYKAPSLGSNGVGIYSRYGGSSDEGAIIITEDTCVIYNSADTGWNFQVMDKDLGTDMTSDATRSFGINQNHQAFSLGGFVKSGSSNSYVLLGGGGHKAESSLSVNYANTTNYANSSNYANSAGNADTLDGYHYNGLPYVERLAWWNYEDSHNADDLLTGTTFVYGNHNAPTTGTMVAFNCNNNIGYPLQLQGQYSGENLYFRNKNGDNGTWNAWRYVIHSGNIGSQSVNYANRSNYANYAGTISGLSNNNALIDWSNEFGSDDIFTAGSTGLRIGQWKAESSGIIFTGDGIYMWAPPDNCSLTFYNEDDGSEIWSIDDSGYFDGSASYANSAYSSTLANALRGGIEISDLNSTSLNRNRIYFHNNNASNRPNTAGKDGAGSFGSIFQISNVDYVQNGTNNHWITQLDFIHHGPIYYRHRINTASWDPWEKIITSKDLPVGVIMMWPSATTPTNWLLCNGQSFSSSEYPDLYSVLGTTVVPNFNGRVPIGAGTGTDTNGRQRGFVANRNYGEYDHVLSEYEMPNHTHNYLNFYGPFEMDVTNAYNAQIDFSISDGATFWEGGTVRHRWASTETSYSKGGSGYHNNIQPSYGIYFIIKAK